MIDSNVILELKAVHQMQDVFVHQLYSYLRATGLPVGYLINFGGTRAEYKRIVLTRNSS